METLLTLFDRVGQTVTFDQALLQRIHQFEREFVNRNPDHVAFFGSNLIGVHPMRFRPQDREVWMNDVLQLDDLELEDGLSDVKYLNPAWKRANDVMNLACVWVVYKLHHNTKLPAAARHEAMVEALLVLQYKFLGSLMAHHYPYPADEATMLAAYAELSRKYSLKVAGSWSALLRQRAEDLLSNRSVHKRAIETFSDKAVVDMVSDIQSRMREMIKAINEVFYAVRERGGRIGRDKTMGIDMDGQEVVRDKTRRYSSYITYLNSVISDKPSFIREELVEIVCDAMHTMPPQLFRETLEWMSLNHRSPKVPEIEELITETLLYAFDLMSSNRQMLDSRAGLMPLLVKLRALYMASRMSDTSLLRAKGLAETIVTGAVKTRNPSVIASLRTAIQLYIVIRALTKHHYSQ